MRSQLVLVLITLLCITLVMLMSKNKKRNKHKKIKENFDDENVIENFPQATPMNVLYSDPSGNLGSTTDLGLQNLTVNGNSSLAGVAISTSDDLSGPSAQTRISNQGIIFGGANNGREGNSAQISAGKHDADALCIVGMSKPDRSNRRIHMWSEGGTIHEGPMAINGNLAISGYGNVKDTISDIYARLAALDNRAGGLESRAGGLETRAGNLEGRAGNLETRVTDHDNNAIFYNKPVLTLANNGTMIGKTSRGGNVGYYSGNLDEFMAFGNCDQCAGGNDKMRLWPGATNTTSFKFVKSY